jgi:chemotaxis protein MotA
MPEENRPGKGAKKKRGSKLDVATIIGALVGIGGIVGGLLAEGGKIRDILQFTAAMIVAGGTSGAVMISTPSKTLLSALRRVRSVVLDSAPRLDSLVDQIIGYATKARKSGLVSLEDDAFEIDDRFLRKAITLAVDGTDLQEIRKMLDLEIGLDEQQADVEAKVFETAGGYAPTIGIIGAVIGLIQVMKNLANIDEVGHGIAVAFVATVYGVGSANLLLLPLASKIKARAHAETHRRELIVEGLAGIVEGLNPKVVRAKLEPFLLEPATENKNRNSKRGTRENKEPAGAEA